ncbi:hypothetical protein [Aeromonas hydrophila]|nr:hypothetical protein [Aeromonas hydrophila]WEA31569.1 hypothetical protein PWO56_07130 [Aeromonas hydrophila]
MGKSVWRSIEYFFTGNYTADDGNNDIDAYGLGGALFPKSIPPEALLPK